MLRLTLIVVGENEDVVLDAVAMVADGTPTMELGETSEAETDDGTKIWWKWEEQ